jgi:ferric-dicitrate binding protein FerR (iron transport regulator)
MEKPESKEEVVREAMKSWRVPGGLSEHAAWEQVQEKIASGKKVKITPFTPNNYRIWATGAVAACLIIFVFFYGSGSSAEEVKISEVGIHALPEGSTVLLNKASAVYYQPASFQEERSLKLDGEAFFEVKEGSTFSVETQNGRINVLGTSFNIKSFGSVLEVKCYTGKVEVQSGSQSSVLFPGKSFRVNPEGRELGSFDPQQADWRQGSFYFENTPLNEVVLEMERQFNVDILYEGGSDRRFTGMFSQGSAEEALSIVAASMNLSFQNLGNNRYLIQ